MGTVRVPDHIPSEVVPELSESWPIPFPFSHTETFEIVFPYTTARVLTRIGVPRIALLAEIVGDSTTGLGVCFPTVRAAICGVDELVLFPRSVAVMTRS